MARRILLGDLKKSANTENIFRNEYGNMDDVR
jgi:hypothetical protein